jgi:hypothetical protein
MMARSTTLQHKAGYIDARPPTASSSKSSCYARPDHTLGQKRRFQRLLGMSAFPQIATELLHHTKAVGKLICGARVPLGCD